MDSPTPDWSQMHMPLCAEETTQVACAVHWHYTESTAATVYIALRQGAGVFRDGDG